MIRLTQNLQQQSVSRYEGPEADTKQSCWLSAHLFRLHIGNDLGHGILRFWLLYIWLFVLLIRACCECIACTQGFYFRSGLHRDFAFGRPRTVAHLKQVTTWMIHHTVWYTDGYESLLNDCNVT
ncbi:hypothetical protein JZ751_000945 [Albula glossodonta]|uniref:Uncharacterized protein n=1 Tax=Albula glossodonta TaxID=121402 RepID=A0A8T2PXT5_9TELE|nr:hypothetical protein JZ751_000945 [Albula glossodonta]